MHSDSPSPIKGLYQSAIPFLLLGGSPGKMANPAAGTQRYVSADQQAQ